MEEDFDVLNELKHQFKSFSPEYIEGLYEAFGRDFSQTINFLLEEQEQKSNKNYNSPIYCNFCCLHHLIIKIIKILGKKKQKKI